MKGTTPALTVRRLDAVGAGLFGAEGDAGVEAGTALLVLGELLAGGLAGSLGKRSTSDRILSVREYSRRFLL